MRNKYGISESFWMGFSEDKKICWKLFTWAVVSIISLLVYKTGIRVLDWLIWGFTTLIMFLIIESQRNLHRYSSILRKYLIRGTVMLCISGIMLAGMAMFILIGFIVTKIAFIDYFENPPIPISYFGSFGAILFIATAIVIALFKSFRDLRFEEMLYHAPLSGLKKMLIERSFVVNDFFRFALFEFLVIIIAYTYSSTVARIAQMFIDIVKINS